MRTKRYDVVFDQISHKLLGFQAHDLVLMSDLIDQCHELELLSPVPQYTGNTFRMLKILLDSMLKKSAPNNAAALLTQALDLMAQTFHDTGRPDAPGELATYMVEAINNLEQQLAEATAYTIQDSQELHGPGPQALELQTAQARVVTEYKQEQHNNDVLGAFLHDARERLARAQSLLLDMEQDPSPELLNELFRIFHTIKASLRSATLPTS